jgi:hypothetical protein
MPRTTYKPFIFKKFYQTYTKNGIENSGLSGNSGFFAVKHRFLWTKANLESANDKAGRSAGFIFLLINKLWLEVKAGA